MRTTFWLKPSLARQIAIRMSLLAVMAVLLLTYQYTIREWEYSQKEMISQSELLLSTISLTLRDPLYNLEIDELKDLAGKIGENPQITMFIVYDKMGRILVNSEKLELEFSQKVDELGYNLVTTPTDEQYIAWQSNQLVTGRGIRVGNQTIGAIAIGFSTQRHDQKVKDLTLQGLALALIVIFLGGLFTFGTARKITSPLSELANVANEMKAGNLSIRANQPKVDDEIGQLSTAFNQMAASIQQRQLELREFADGLERTVNERTAELQEQAKILEEMAITDPLTQAYNRRQFFKLAKIEMERAQNTGVQLSVIVIDADHYKRVNDTFGHQIGDLVLIKLVEICHGAIRKTDVFARYGGEEFVILMPETDSETARLIAERIRERVENTRLPVNGQVVQITISLGISTFNNIQELSFDSLLTQADRALYKSKRTGRNRVTVWAEEVLMPG
jgi:diguanylate cyclase (GGDEF)-like protein